MSLIKGTAGGIFGDIQKVTWVTYWKHLNRYHSNNEASFYVMKIYQLRQNYFLPLLHKSKSHFFLWHGLQGTFVNKPLCIKMFMSTVSLKISSWGLKGFSGSNTFIKRLRIGYFHNPDKKWGRHFFLIKMQGGKISGGGGQVQFFTYFLKFSSRDKIQH